MLVRGIATVSLLVMAAAASAQTPAQATQLTAARRAFNQAQFDQAITSALDARRAPALAATAGVVLGRAYIERFISKSDAADLTLAHNVLAELDAARLSASDRRDYTIGLGLTVFYEGQPGAAAELLEVALGMPLA